MARASIVTQIAASAYTYPEGHPEGPGPGELFVYAVSADSGIYVVDTGIGADNAWINEHYRPTPFDLLGSLAQLGIPASAVTAIICSHLHFDHCGSNRLFPRVPIYVQRAEYEAARQQGYTVRQWVDFEGAEYRLLDGSTRLGSSVEIVATPGHTPGHQSVFVQAGQRTECIVAQAAYSAAEFSAYRDRANAEVREDCWSKTAYAASLRGLHDRRPARAYFSHDATVWRDEAPHPHADAGAS